MLGVGAGRVFPGLITLKTGSSSSTLEWFSMAWLVKFMIFKYRCRLEHLLHILLFDVLMWTFYFVNNNGNDCGAWKKLPLKF